MGGKVFSETPIQQPANQGEQLLHLSGHEQGLFRQDRIHRPDLLPAGPDPPAATVSERHCILKITVSLARQGDHFTYSGIIGDWAQKSA